MTERRYDMDWLRVLAMFAVRRFGVMRFLFGMRGLKRS